jgi:protein TonB
MLALRIPFAAVTGALFSLAVFFGLWQLVGVPFDAGDPVIAHEINFTRQIIETPTESTRDPQIERTPPPLVPRTPHPGGGLVSEPPTEFRPTAIPIIARPTGPSMTGIDRDPIPLVRVAPDYPPRAQASGTEGWVQVQFAITPTGSVRDAAVVASEPGTVFDDAALKAIARWRYNPRVDGGVAVERVGMQTVIRFQLKQ